METAKRDNEIILHREGIFYIAYEQSAWLFSVALHAFRVKRLFVKCVAQDVVSIGFPMTSLGKFTGGCEVVDEDSIVHLLLPNGDLPQSCDFESWKAMQAGEDSGRHTAESLADDAIAKKMELLERIDGFPIESKSPIECMLFLSEIKAVYKNL